MHGEGLRVNKRPIPEATARDIDRIVYGRKEAELLEVLCRLSPYAYDPFARGQLRSLAKSPFQGVRSQAMAILKRQHTVDTGTAFFCAACAHLDPSRTFSGPSRSNGVMEMQTLCSASGEHVWPSIHKCHKYEAASSDRLFRQHVKRNRVGKHADDGWISSH